MYNWKALALLSIVLPIGSLAALRLTGVLEGPPTVETITAEAVSWNMSRPTRITTIDEWTKNVYANNIVSINLSVHVVGYREDWLVWPSDGDDDIVDLRIVATANISQISQGFIYSVVVNFSRTDTLADIVFQQSPWSMELRNLEIAKIRDLGASTREAYFETAALNQPKNTTLSIIAYWVFLDGNSADHWVTLNLETTYFNGTAYQKVMTPIKLGVVIS